MTFYSEYTYDNGNLILEFTYSWDYFAENWGDYSKVVYTYSGGRVATEEVWGFDWFQIMMVPQNYYVYTWNEKFDRLHLELYNLTGKQVISRSIENHETLDVDQVARGVYLYRLRDHNDLIHTGKISLK